MKKTSGVYKITNKITDDFYIGSSKNIIRRWSNHKCPSTWKKRPGMLLYKAFRQYGLENFDFVIVEETDSLYEREQYFIDLLKPEYNIRTVTTGMTIKEYYRSYNNQLCFYKGKQLTLNALTQRFWRDNLPNPMTEAREYLIDTDKTC